MTRPVVGILGRRDEPEVKALAAAVQAQGGVALVMDLRTFPRASRLTMSGGGPPRPGASCWQWDDVLAEAPITLDDLDVACVRALAWRELPADAVAHATAPAAARHYRHQVARLAAQLALVRRLGRRVPLVNPPDAFVAHRTKAWQQRLWHAEGLPVPRSLTTADPLKAADFIREIGGNAVAKPQASGAEVVPADRAFFATWAGRGAPRPTLFQRNVKGRAVRAYFLGGRCVSCGELVHDPRHLDWRGHTRHVRPFALDPSLARDLGRAARAQGLPYCGMDLEYHSESARYQLLDMSPAALFVGWSRLRGHDLASMLAAFLLRLARDGRQGLWDEETT